MIAIIKRLYLIIPIVLASDYECPKVCRCDLITLRVECDGNSLSTIPDNIDKEIASLDLSRNVFQNFPTNLSELKKLRFLNLSHNLLTILDDNSLEGFDALEVLDLSNNLFTDWRDIHENSLLPALVLKELHLSHNPLRGFPDLVLHPLQSESLEYLYIINCSITNIFSDILIRMPNVKELYLRDNRLFVLNTQIKSNNLEKLDMSHCALERIANEAFASMPSLQNLLLSRNYHLKKFNSQSNTLKYLDISRCNLESVPNGYWPLLTIANFGGNHFRYIKNSSFQAFPLLEALDISNNSLERIEKGAFRGIPNLMTVDLSFNTLSDVPAEIFVNCPQLLKVDLSRNYLTRVTHFVSDSIRWLDLSVCEIRDLSRKSLSMLPKLQNLNLSRNLITSLPDRFQAPSLTNLDLSICRIVAINNVTFKETPHLLYVNLSGNRLTSVSIKPSFFANVKEVQLGDNPWFCDCGSKHMKEMFEWQFRMRTASTLLCRLPETIAGLKWQDACRYNWGNDDRPQPKRMWAYSLLVAVLMIGLLCIVLGIRQRYRQKELERELELQAHDREEALERLQRIRRRPQESEEVRAFQNAPDPREAPRPPSYAEAVCMTASCSSLNESRRNHAIPEGRIPQSCGDLTASNSQRKRRLRPENERKPSTAFLRSQRRPRSTARSDDRLDRRNTDITESDL